MGKGSQRRWRLSNPLLAWQQSGRDRCIVGLCSVRTAAGWNVQAAVVQESDWVPDRTSCCPGLRHPAGHARRALCPHRWDGMLLGWHPEGVYKGYGSMLQVGEWEMDPSQGNHSHGLKPAASWKRRPSEWTSPIACSLTRRVLAWLIFK